MVKNGKSDKTRSKRKKIMSREIKAMMRSPAVLNAKEAKEFRAILNEVAEFTEPQDPFERLDVEDYAYDRVEIGRLRRLKAALIKRHLKRALTEWKAKLDRRIQHERGAVETELLTNLSKLEALPDKAELERLEAESNAELTKRVAKLLFEYEEEKKRLEQELSSLGDAVFLEHWIGPYEQVDRLQSTAEKRAEDTRSRLERRAPGELLRNRAEVIDGTAIEEPLVAQQSLIVPAATRPDLPAPTATDSQPESVAAVLTAEEPEALRPQVMIEPPATEFDMPDQAATGSRVETGGTEGRAEEPQAVRPQGLIEPPATEFDMLEPTGSQVEALVAELPAAKPDMLEPTAELAAEQAVRPLVAIEPPATEFDMPDQAATGSQVETGGAEGRAEEPEAVRPQVMIEPLATEFDMLEPAGLQVEALVAELPAAKPDMLEPTAELAAEQAVRQLVASEPPSTEFDMPDQAATGSHLEMARAERPAAEPALAPRQEIDCTPVGADLIDRAAADAEVEALAAQATPEQVAVIQCQNMEPRTIEPALQLLAENPTAAVEMLQLDAAKQEPEVVERVVSAPPLRPASTTALSAVAQKAGLSLSATTPRTARPELMPAVSKATTKPAKISSRAIPSGPAPAWAGIAALLGIDPQQAVAIEFAGAKKTGTTAASAVPPGVPRNLMVVEDERRPKAASSVPPGIPRNMQGIYRQLNPPPRR